MKNVKSDTNLTLNKTQLYVADFTNLFTDAFSENLQ